ncbi:MAG: ABC transporter substrate-binding protein [Proteobacteria bacterium]|nr:ABC transporter substrate-binding protein [Pseudomonadota bacterium]
MRLIRFGRRRRAIATAGIVVAGLGFAAAAPSFAADKVHFQTDWIPSGEHAMYYGGWDKGFWKEQGIDINITRGYGSGDTVTKIAGKAADFGVADIGAVFTARARTGTPVKTIMTLYTHSPHSLFVLKSSGITNFKGLEGKKIGITPGNSHRVYFPKVAEKAGTDPNKIVWVNTDGAAMAALLIAKRLDAAPFYSIHHYYQNKAAQKAGEEIVVLPFVEVGFAIYAASIIANDDMIKGNPDLVRRFLKAVENAFKWAKANPEETCQMHVKRVPEVAFDDCMGSVKATLGFVFTDSANKFGFGKYDPERLKFTWEAVAESQGIDPKWDHKQAIDVSLVP